MPLDQRSITNISSLSAATAALALELASKAADHGVQIQIISGYRSIHYQDVLYAQGRTTPGPRVTNARGGYSAHNFRIAFDIGVFEGPRYIPESTWYRTLGDIGESLGLRWGGRWISFPDAPHYHRVPSWAKYGKDKELLQAFREHPEYVGKD